MKRLLDALAESAMYGPEAIAAVILFVWRRLR